MATINWNHPNLQKLPSKKVELLKCIAKDLDKLSSTNSLSYILALNSKLKEENITFSKEEYVLLLSAISGNIPDFLIK